MKYICEYNEYVDGDHHIQVVKDILQDTIDEHNMEEDNLNPHKEGGIYYFMGQCLDEGSEENILLEFTAVKSERSFIDPTRTLMKVRLDIERDMKRLESMGYVVSRSGSYKYNGDAKTQYYIDYSNI